MPSSRRPAGYTSYDFARRVASFLILTPTLIRPGSSMMAFNPGGNPFIRDVVWGGNVPWGPRG